MVLDFDSKRGLDMIPYSMNNYQPATERHHSTFWALTNATASQVKIVNLQRTPEPLPKVVDKVFLSIKNIYLKNVSPSMKPLWIGLFTIPSANYNYNNYSLDLSTNLSVNLTCHNFHSSKIKSYINHNPTLFRQQQLVKPGRIAQGRYEVEKVIAYYKAPRTSTSQY